MKSKAYILRQVAELLLVESPAVVSVELPEKVTDDRPAGGLAGRGADVLCELQVDHKDARVQLVWGQRAGTVSVEGIEDLHHLVEGRVRSELGLGRRSR